MKSADKRLRQWVRERPWSSPLSTRAVNICFKNGFSDLDLLRDAVLRGEFLPLHYCKFRDCGYKTAIEIYDLLELKPPTVVAPIISVKT